MLRLQVYGLHPATRTQQAENRNTNNENCCEESNSHSHTFLDPPVSILCRVFQKQGYPNFRCDIYLVKLFALQFLNAYRCNRPPRAFCLTPERSPVPMGDISIVLAFVVKDAFSYFKAPGIFLSF